MTGRSIVERIAGRLRRALDFTPRPSAPTVRIVRFRGVRFLVWVNEDIGWRIILQGTYEPFVLDALLKHIQPDDVCADIGANIGIFTVLLARQAHRGHVHAFEPLEHNASMLRINAEVNGVNNYTLHSQVVSDTNGVIEFAIAEDGAYSSIRHTGRKPLMRTGLVEATRLDTFVASLDRPIDVVKIDVEGAELLVLRGAGDVLRSDHAPRVILAEACAENSRAYGYAPGDLIEFMRECSYVAQTIPHPRGLFQRGTADADEEILFLKS